MLQKLEAIQKEFNASATGGKKVSLADLIVLGGGAAVEKAAKNAGHDVKVPFTPGRMDASQEQTDAQSFAAARADRRRLPQLSTAASDVMPPEEALVDKAQLLTLTAPEMTVLVGGLRVLGANAGKSTHGVFTKKPGTLTNDFFVNLLDMSTEWKPAQGERTCTKGATGRPERDNGPRPASTSSSARTRSLRALAEVYASADAKEKFVKDFAKAWTKVMDLDRFDLVSRDEPARMAAE